MQYYTIYITGTNLLITENECQQTIAINIDIDKHDNAVIDNVIPRDTEQYQYASISGGGWQSPMFRNCNLFPSAIMHSERSSM